MPADDQHPARGRQRDLTRQLARIRDLAVIEGSTRLVKALRERHAQVLAGHQSLARGKILEVSR